MGPQGALAYEPGTTAFLDNLAHRGTGAVMSIIEFPGRGTVRTQGNSGATVR